MPYQLNPETGEWTHTSSNPSGGGSSGGGNFNSNSQTASSTTPSNSASESSATAGSQSSGSKTEMSDVDGNGSAIGNVKIRKNAKVIVTGIAKRWEGIYYIANCKHTINGNGYTTEFGVKTNKNDIGKKTVASSGSGSSGSSKSSGSSSSKSSSSSSSKKSSSSSSSGYKYVLDPETGKYKKVKK